MKLKRSEEQTKQFRIRTSTPNFWTRQRAVCPKDVCICIALPIRVNQQGEVDHMAKDLAEYIEGLGYKTIESHMVYIHRSLTREIMVYEKT